LQFVNELAREMIENGEDRIRSGKNRVSILMPA